MQQYGGFLVVLYDCSLGLYVELYGGVYRRVEVFLPRPAST